MKKYTLPAMMLLIFETVAVTLWIGSGKRGYVIALRTGPNMPECEKIIGSIEHFYGHLEIECKGHLGLTSIEYRDDVEPRKKEIMDFCTNI